MVDHLGERHECVVRNYVPFLSAPDYAFPVAEEPGPGAASEGAEPETEFLDEVMPEGHDEVEDAPGWRHDFTHLRKRSDCEACRAKVKAAHGDVASVLRSWVARS